LFAWLFLVQEDEKSVCVGDGAGDPLTPDGDDGEEVVSAVLLESVELSDEPVSLPSLPPRCWVFAFVVLFEAGVGM
jgi:hypothetical protein